MQEPATAQWGLNISAADFQKLKAGFEPQDQDDKWQVTVNKHDQGTISVHIARSGTGKELYVVEVKPDSSGNANIESVTWDQDKGGIRMSEEQAKKEATLLVRRVLDCDIEALPEYDVSEMWSHAGAQVDAK